MGFKSFAKKDLSALVRLNSELELLEYDISNSKYPKKLKSYILSIIKDESFRKVLSDSCITFGSSIRIIDDSIHDTIGNAVDLTIRSFRRISKLSNDSKALERLKDRSPIRAVIDIIESLNNTYKKGRIGKLHVIEDLNFINKVLYYLNLEDGILGISDKDYGKRLDLLKELRDLYIEQQRFFLNTIEKSNISSTIIRNRFYESILDSIDRNTDLQRLIIYKEDILRSRDLIKDTVDALSAHISLIANKDKRAAATALSSILRLTLDSKKLLVKELTDALEQIDERFIDRHSSIVKDIEEMYDRDIYDGYKSRLEQYISIIEGEDYKYHKPVNPIRFYFNLLYITDSTEIAKQYLEAFNGTRLYELSYIETVALSKIVNLVGREYSGLRSALNVDIIKKAISLIQLANGYNEDVAIRSVKLLYNIASIYSHNKDAKVNIAKDYGANLFRCHLLIDYAIRAISSDSIEFNSLTDLIESASFILQIDFNRDTKQHKKNVFRILDKVISEIDRGKRINEIKLRDLDEASIDGSISKYPEAGDISLITYLKSLTGFIDSYRDI
ncbi:MAG: hypothetical protein ARM1_0665 [Candidatus Micrarchaeota archaeon]|nr:MAG: hypothetical protein ARM1_0665 [Candidatus Micrarchaeota archaeon]